jgi:putative FmdB family regulatory protein
MPIYEYECSKCGQKIEVIQKISDKPLKKHAGCGGGLTKLISAAAFQFKGTGWYVTDYARKGSRDSGSGSTTGEGKETSSNEKKDASADKSASTKAAKKDSSSKSNGSKG